jgi:hypothetical protein
MRRALIYKWRWFLTGAVVGIAGFITAFLIGTHNLSKTTENFARSSAVAIFSGWDDKELLDRASPDFLKNAHPDAIHNSFNNLSKLGKLTRVDQLEGGPHYIISLTGPNTATATYSGTAEFENGKLQFQIDLIDGGPVWQIKAFRITTP